MSFESLNLHSNINKAIAACGYTTPTPVQEKSIPLILEGRDVVVSAQTGTGKTAAFVLPALNQLIASEEKPSKKPRILILTPTRELASQINKAASLYGKFLKFNIVSLLGGMPYHHQIKDLARGADILVATPGRLLDHMENKRVDLSNIQMLVLDEADRMLDMGFIDDVQYIAKLTPAKRQTLLFSATVDNKLVTVVKHLLKNPARIDLSSEKVASPQIKQEMYKANNLQHKSRLLKHFLNDKNIFKAIIFSATKVNADKIAFELRDEGFAAAALHGDLKQNVRNRTIEQLRRGKIQYLVATDVAARGIDISDITHVINFDLPKFCEDYVHRIGRTGRAGKSGIAISFVLPADTKHLQRIERYIGQRIKLIQNVDLTLSPKNDSVHQDKPFVLNESDDDQDRSSDHKRSNRHGDRHERSSRFRNDESRDRAPRFRNEESKDRAPRFRSDENKDRAPRFRSDESKDRAPRFRSDENKDRAPRFRSDESKDRAPRFRSDENKDRAPRFRSDESKSRPSRFRDNENKDRAPRFRDDESKERAPRFRDDKERPDFKHRTSESKKESPFKKKFSAKKTSWRSESPSDKKTEKHEPRSAKKRSSSANRWSYTDKRAK